MGETRWETTGSFLLCMLFLFGQGRVSRLRRGVFAARYGKAPLEAIEAWRAEGVRGRFHTRAAGPASRFLLRRHDAECPAPGLASLLVKFPTSRRGEVP